jgi:predicted metal-binding membrane protein
MRSLPQRCIKSLIISHFVVVVVVLAIANWMQVGEARMRCVENFLSPIRFLLAHTRFFDNVVGVQVILASQGKKTKENFCSLN